jgi:D-alanine transaminase/branched-chain amino acid aminotransferase
VVPYSKAELQDLIYQLIRKNEIQNCGIRITLTGGYSEDGYLPAVPNLFITTHTLPDQFKEHYDTGIPLTIWEHQRQLPDVKSIDYLMAIWLQPVLLQKEAFDVLYHSRGWITECPRSNFFIITKDDILVTPMDGILKGITRKQILKIADSILPIEERPVSLEELKHAKEAFITSTSKVILPVSRIDNLFQNNGQTPFTDMLLEAFLQYRAKDISSAANKGNR